MAIYVRCVHSPDENAIIVNGKIVRKDMDGTWKQEETLTMTEAKAFDSFRTTLENSIHVISAEFNFKK